MWALDFWLAVALLAVVPFYLAVRGGHMAAETIQDTWKRRRTKMEFWGVGLLGVLIAIAYQYRATKSDAKKMAATEQWQRSISAQLDEIFRNPKSTNAQKDQAVKLRASVERGPRQELPKNPQDDPDVRLLKEAEETYKSLTNWQAQAEKALENVDKECERENQIMKLSPEKLKQHCDRKYEDLHDRTMLDYQQTYSDKLLEERRRIIAEVPEGTLGYTMDYRNPGNLGGITGLRSDFSGLIATYKVKLMHEGKVAPKP